MHSMAWSHASRLPWNGRPRWSFTNTSPALQVKVESFHTGRERRVPDVRSCKNNFSIFQNRPVRFSIPATRGQTRPVPFVPGALVAGFEMGRSSAEGRRRRRKELTLPQSRNDCDKRPAAGPGHTLESPANPQP
jgi:hypothetical protein